MRIKLDTGVMYDMSSCAQKASQYVDESSEVAYRIVPHDDWNCQERDYINQGIETIRKFQKKISEKFMHFSKSVAQVATQFLEAEAALPNLFGEADVCAGQILSLVGEATSTIGATTQGLASVVKSFPSEADSLQNYASALIDAPLQICNFSDIDLGNSEV